MLCGLLRLPLRGSPAHFIVPNAAAGSAGPANEACSATTCPTRPEISCVQIFRRRCDLRHRLRGAAGPCFGGIHAPVGDVSADANFGLLPGRRDGPLRWIGAGKYSAGIKAAAALAKNWRSTAVQGIGRCAANFPAGLIQATEWVAKWHD